MTPISISWGEFNVFICCALVINMDKSILIPSFFRLFVGFNKDLRDSFPPKKE